MVIFAGCAQEKIPDEKITNVARIFMHEPHRFSVFIQSPQSQEVIVRELKCHREDGVKFFTDVAPTENAWILLQFRNVGRFGWDITNIVMHIHNVQEMEGAGWDHGKHGRGQTQVIQ